jgi:hypothetical protein
MADVAAELFAKIATEGFKALKLLIEGGEGETPYIDYKENRSEDPAKKFETSSELSKAGRHVFGKLASAFANSDGGLIVWGVEAKDNHPIMRRPMNDPAGFVQSLNGQTANVLEPGLPGIQHLPIDDPELGGGYVVTYIPRSEIRPHMCVQGERTYYMRVGSSSIPMPHFAVRDAVLARARPTLRLSSRSPSLGGTNVQNRTEIQYTARTTLRIANVGPILARYCAFVLSDPEGNLQFNPIGAPGRPVTVDEEPGGTDNWSGRLYSLGQEVLYPGMSLDVGELIATFFADAIPERLGLRYAVYADGFSYQGFVEVPLTEWPQLNKP